ncbi:MAG: sporulation integral membrane protein YtvI [Firmicutes bacterium HGW-Firmicutes-21]|nr:MAG: sporulation integral membrane protein YtvI [Firmicutes bacterium HGW-Firmicutes-21]
MLVNIFYEKGCCYMLPQEPYKKIAIILFYITVIVVASYLFLKYMFGLLLPFIIAYVIAAALQPAVRFLCKHAKVPKKLSVLVLVLVATTLLGLFCYLAICRIYTELTVLSQNVKGFIDHLRSDEQYAQNLIDRISDSIPFVDMRDRLGEIWTNLDSELESFLLSLADKLSGSILPILGGIITFVPNALLVIVVVILSTYYLAVDYKKINRFIMAQLPEKAAGSVRMFKKEFVGTIIKFLRAYGLIVLITFFQLFVAFTILGIKYAFLIALFTALVDILPVLGTGTVLIPWSLFLLMTGDYYTGVALIIVYIVIAIIRQIMEPKIVGKYIGLYPLLTLIAMYVGLKVFGIIGLLLLPILTIIIKKLNDEGKIRLFKKPTDRNESQIKG